MSQHWGRGAEERPPSSPGAEARALLSTPALPGEGRRPPHSCSPHPSAHPPHEYRISPATPVPQQGSVPPQDPLILFGRGPGTESTIA